MVGLLVSSRVGSLVERMVEMRVGWMEWRRVARRVDHSAFVMAEN